MRTRSISWPRARSGRTDWILTPHPGEAGRLLGTNAAAVQADRLAALDALLARYGGTVVLKGRGHTGRDGGRSPGTVRARQPRHGDAPAPAMC